MWRCRLPLSLSQASSRTPWTSIGIPLAASALFFSVYDGRKKDEAEVNKAVSLSSSSASISSRNIIDTTSLPESTPLNVSESCKCEAAPKPDRARFFSYLARRRTVRKIASTSTQDSVDSKYNVDWNAPIGEGSFGAVYLATDKKSGEKYALKKMTKNCTDKVTFQREINALLHLRANGSHPNICSLHEHFEEEDSYYFVLDLISGGEMFDYLSSNGPYSEADAARMMREVASALAFLHGIGIVHCDLKPGNLMLRTKSRNATVKLIDFGCADVITEEDNFRHLRSGTVAFCPPEALDRSNPKRTERQPSFDMWSLGIVLHIMLTGSHPFDPKSDTPPAEIKRRIEERDFTPLRESPAAKHLSDSAISCVEKLMEWDPAKRSSALEMLHHPWVKGETASQTKMAGSDKKLSTFRAFRSDLAAQVFANMISWAEEDKVDANRMPLIERAFQSLDSQEKGFITPKDLQESAQTPLQGMVDEIMDTSISLSEFDGLLSEHMKSKHFSKGDIIYKENDVGHNMFVINSGTVDVSTKKGFTVRLGQGDFFGEGALLHPNHIRSATVKCETPVHAIEISEEYFKKYMESSTLLSKLHETDKARKRDMSLSVLGLQNNLVPIELTKGENLYRAGEEGKELFVLQEGQVNVRVHDSTVLIKNPGDVCGVHSLLSGRPRNDTAVCVSDVCKIQKMNLRDFDKLIKSSPVLQESFRDLQ